MCVCVLQGVLGTNPICVAAPAKNGDSFVLDMATTAVALGKVSRRKLSNIYIQIINMELRYQWRIHDLLNGGTTYYKLLKLF